MKVGKGTVTHDERKVEQMAELNDDLDQDYDGEDEDQGGNSPNSNPMNQLRAQLRAEQKSRKADSKELAQLRAFKAELDSKSKVDETGKLFEQMGLNPAHARLYFAVNGGDAEVSAEKVAKFAIDNVLGVPAEKKEAIQELSEGQKFVPVSPGSAVPASNLISREEFKALKRANPRAAAQAVSERRVEGFNYDAEVNVRGVKSGGRGA